MVYKDCARNALNSNKYANEDSYGLRALISDCMRLVAPLKKFGVNKAECNFTPDYFFSRRGFAFV